jgi:hypothetical protein
VVYNKADKVLSTLIEIAHGRKEVEHKDVFETVPLKGCDITQFNVMMF